MSKYKLNGKPVYPPEGWIRRSNWSFEDGCVKACKICGEALWRKIYEEAGVWKNKKMHPHCLGEYRIIQGRERRAKQKEQNVNKPKAISPEAALRRAERMDMEQHRNNMAVDEIIRERMATPLTFESAGKYAAAAMWLFI